MLQLEARHGAHAVGQQHDAAGAPAGCQKRQVLHDVFGGGAHAVAAGLARNQQHVRRGERCEQAGVEGGAGVGGVGHFGLDGAVVLRPRVHALEDVRGGALAAHLPVAAGRKYVGMHAVAPAADLAVHGPDHERVAALGFERIQVDEHARQRLRVARCEGARAHLGCGDRSEGRDIAAVAALPEAWVGDVKALVRILGEADLADAIALSANERGEPLHVGMCTGHGQRGHPGDLGGKVAEIVLGVDGEQVNGAGHRA